MPCHHQQANSRDQQPAHQTLVGRRGRADVLMRTFGDGVGLAAQHRAKAISESAKNAQDDARSELPAGHGQMFSGGESQRHAGQDDRPAGHLPDRQPRIFPEPFGHRADQSRPALVDEDGQARPQQRKALKQENIRAHPDDSAQEKKRERCAAQTLAEQMRPQTQQHGGGGQPPEIGFRSSHQPGRARPAHGRTRPQNCC